MGLSRLNPSGMNVRSPIIGYLGEIFVVLPFRFSDEIRIGKKTSHGGGTSKNIK